MKHLTPYRLNEPSLSPVRGKGMVYGGGLMWLRLFQFVEIHLVDFVESLLIKFPGLPQCIEPILHFSRIMAVKYVLQLIEPILTLVQGEHLKQMNLQWIENGCFHNYNFLFSGQGRCKPRAIKFT